MHSIIYYQRHVTDFESGYHNSGNFCDELCELLYMRINKINGRQTANSV